MSLRDVVEKFVVFERKSLHGPAAQSTFGSGSCEHAHRVTVDLFR